MGEAQKGLFPCFERFLHLFAKHDQFCRMKRLDLGLEPDDKEFHAMLEALVTAHGVTMAAEFVGVPDRTLRHWRCKAGGATPAHLTLVWRTYLVVMHPGAIQTASDLHLCGRDKRAGWPTLPPLEPGAANLLPPGEPPSPPAVVTDPARIRQKLVTDSLETISRLKKAMEIAEAVTATTKDKEQKVKTLGMIAILAKSQSDLSDLVNDILKEKASKPDSGLPETPSFYLQLKNLPSASETPAKNGNETEV